tara:strand:+ start:22935 stop:26270 length:3336 start_codon:yes stop_codon:yes gene_type:complete
MKEIKAESIQIDGASEIFGGKIYNASFTNNFSDSPSAFTINVVNETGEYDIPDLDARSIKELYEITIGETLFGQYSLVKTRTSVNKSGKVLELTFFDITMNFDKIFIGLHKKHGIIPRSEPKGGERLKSYSKEDTMLSLNGIGAEGGGEEGDLRPMYHIQLNEQEEITPLIILGREFHPCDTNRDGYLNLDEDIFKVDGCDPCPTCPEDKYDGSLDRQRCLDLECSEIFEVRYNFKALIDAITEFFEKSKINIVLDPEGIPEINELYFADYEGTLREVLKRWGADFSFNFYVENLGDEPTLKFADTSVETDIIGKKELEQEDIISFEETQSVENTQNIGTISLYKQGGERKIYDCSTSVKLDLKPMHLTDLYNDTDDALLGRQVKGNDFVSFEDLEVSVALTKYSTAIREQFWYGYIYGADGGRPGITCLQYVGPPDTTSSSSGEEAPEFSLPVERQGGLGERSKGITESEGIDELNEEDLCEIARNRGILQLGEMKLLAFFFPTGIDGEEPEIYHNRGTEFNGGMEGVIPDLNNKACNLIKDAWNPSAEELDFFSQVPLFGGIDLKFDPEDPDKSRDTFTVESFSRGYFVLASRKEEMLEKIIDNEKRLGNEFIGKYFATEIHPQDNINVCGYDKYGRKDYSRKNITIKGGGEFYNYNDGDTSKFLESPLFSFGHSKGSKIGQLQDRLKGKEKITILQDGQDPFDEGIIIQKTGNTFFPEEGATNDIKKFISIYERKRMQIIPLDPVTLSTFIAKFAPEHVNDANVKMFAFYPDDFSDGFDIERDIIHPSIKVNATDSRGRDVSSGCYGDCENDKECFEGEKNPERLAKLEAKMSDLVPNSTHFRAVRREIQGDNCVNGICQDKNACTSNESCESFESFDGETFSEYECVNGECIEKLGLQSSITTRLDINGFKIFAPPHGFAVPSGRRIFIPSIETFEPRSYRSILEYQKRVEVFIPKVEHMIQDNIEKFDSSFAKFNVNLYQIPIDDLNLFYREGLATQTCRPSDELLEKLHEDFNQNLSYNLTDPRKNIRVSIVGISEKLSDPEIITKGLESFNINLSSDGVTSSYVFGNKIMQPIPIDVTRRLIDILQRRTNSHLNYTQSVKGLIN